MTIDGLSDVLRIVNAVLCLACIYLTIRTRAAQKALRPFVFAVAMLLGWQAYTSIEVTIGDTESTMVTVIRIGGFTVVLSVMLGVLIWESRRRRHYINKGRSSP